MLEMEDGGIPENTLPFPVFLSILEISTDANVKEGSDEVEYAISEEFV